MSSSQLLRAVIENPLTLPLYVKDHFIDLMLPMAGYAGGVSVLCRLTRSIFAKMGSPETGGPLAIGFALFCYKFKAKRIEEPLQWSVLGALGYAYAVKNINLSPLIIAALGTAALTYLHKTGQLPEQTSKECAPSFLDYSFDHQNDARIQTLKTYVDNFKTLFFKA